MYASLLVFAQALFDKKCDFFGKFTALSLFFFLRGLAGHSLLAV